jgi:hypothetical protein
MTITTTRVGCGGADAGCDVDLAGDGNADGCVSEADGTAGDGAHAATRVTKNIAAVEAVRPRDDRCTSPPYDDVADARRPEHGAQEGTRTRPTQVQNRAFVFGIMPPATAKSREMPSVWGSNWGSNRPLRFWGLRMIQPYDRDAALVAAVLPLVVDLRRARPGEPYGAAAEALKIWQPQGVEAPDVETTRALGDARFQSIVAEINAQLGGSSAAAG